MLPVYEWNSHTIVACINPQAVSLEWKVLFIVSSPETLEQLWEYLQNMSPSPVDHNEEEIMG